MPPELIRLWLSALYASLRRAEARAADMTLPSIDRRCARATAQYIARQILTQEAALLRRPSR